MCSVSWQQEQNDILICFNRDEQKNRVIAKPPSIHMELSRQVIMPIDPDGGGTWISVNQFGMFFGLLNFYEADSGKKAQKRSSNGYTSRGLLLRQLSICRNLSEFDAQFAQQNLSEYRPFKIMMISTEIKKLFVWNGVKLLTEKLNGFICSSSYQSQSVLQYRHEQFKQAKNDRLKLHRDHTNRKDAYSICMHRDDAQTVSLSVIRINLSQITFQYWNGSPCSTTPSEIISLAVT